MLMLFGSHVGHAFEFRKLDVQMQASDSLVLQKGAWTGMQVYAEFNKASLTVMIDGQGFTLKQDPHLPKGYSQVFTFPVFSELVLRAETNIMASVFLVAAPLEVPLVSHPNPLLKKTSCEKPVVVPPSVWRIGLPDPAAGRELNEAQHVVIHHSAGSNLNTNWVEVVRSIYLLHVQTNNWDDIGYNYLIAGDGAVFIGRDPLDLLLEDEVRGAHFCSKNTGTMGVCLIGTFSDVSPTKNAMNALGQLLLWKLFKEDISPLDSFIHPKGGLNHLASVCGHRDGCATECPGDVLYTRLDSLKTSLYQPWMDCRIMADVQEIAEPTKGLLYPNPLVGKTLNFRRLSHQHMPTAYRLLSINSRVVQEGVVEGEILEFSEFISAGRYLLQLKIEERWMHMPLIVQ